jgi:membrane glycosyltransferase
LDLPLGGLDERLSVTRQTIDRIRRHAFQRRLVFAILIVATIVIGALAMASALAANGLSALEWTQLVLFVILFSWIAPSFWTSLFGFAVILRGGDPFAITRTLEPWEAGRRLPVRTAIVIPVYNEDPERVMAGVASTMSSLDDRGVLADFDTYILSDTDDPELWVEEELAFSRLRDFVRDPDRLFYRKRRENVDRKVGNIADFCARWGDRYRYMIVFDADSVMSGGTLVHMVRLMERNPGVGLIQVPPMPVSRETLFGRIQQFAAGAYGGMFATGLNWWQAGEGNYWGHNAIIRIRPFVDHCRLPVLSGTEPLGGAILSHDFVEAALMRRAGWTVWLASELDGSYEETPPTLIDHAARDRRWCQGNLQHVRLIGTRGLNLISRLHLLMGIMSYLASPLWMLLLLVATIEAARAAMLGPVYFDPERSLFPVWQVSTTTRTLILYLVTLGMLLSPKLLAILAHAARGKLRGFGGAVRLTMSVLLEALFSMLLAPVMAVLQTRFVLSVLAGRKVTWAGQQRQDATTTLSDAVRRHGGSTALGFVWGVAAYRFMPDFFWWLTPVLAGLVLSIPLSMLSSRPDMGRAARALGMFLIPEEIEPPQVLARLPRFRAQLRADASLPTGLSRLISDPEARRIHLGLLPEPVEIDPLQRHHLTGLRLKARLRGLEALTRQERMEVMLDRFTLEALAHEMGGADLPPPEDGQAVAMLTSLRPSL